MSFFPALATWQFAVAGALCAAGPIILHLLNRRRFRVVEWGAMQFLREAMQRSRRVMQVRDLILMLLRAAAVLLFGMALARPFLTAQQEQHDAGQPIHAVLLIDNSLSMGYQTLDGTLLDRAKLRAADFIERLPVGSRISVSAVAGGDVSAGEPMDTKPAALETLQRIQLVDRSMTLQRALNEARRVDELVQELAPRVVLYSDHQRTNWIGSESLLQDAELPPVQLVDVSDGLWDNTWVSELEIPDGVADTETPTVIRAAIRHRGTDPRRDVRVSLWIRDQEIDSRIVSFESNDATQEVTFEHTFRDAFPDESQPDLVPVKVTLSPDRLVADDERHLIVPVVAVLPVVFIDQFGTSEDPARNRFGETRHLRQLLAPAVGAREDSRQLIQIRHLQIEELSRDVLADARLVVVAGVSDPEGQVSLLREYVEQGGQLLITAGAEFDPTAWNASGWQDGAGILPLPLTNELLGSLPGAAGGDLKPMFLSFESLGQHPYFHLAGNSEDDLRDLYAEPFFFQAVQVDASPATLDKAVKAGTTTSARQRWLSWNVVETGSRGNDETQDTEPSASKDGASNGQTTEGHPAASARESVNALRPRILARLNSESGPAFLVERAIGSGKVVLATSSVLSDWNTLPKTHAIVIFDRILRSMLQATLPSRNYGPIEEIAVLLPNEVRDERVVLQRPGDAVADQLLEPGFLGNDAVGVTIERPLVRGVYQIQATRDGTNGSSTQSASKWQVALAVNGDEAESDLERFTQDAFAQHPVSQEWRWVGSGEEVNIAGARIRGQDLWWWLALAVLLILLGELALVGWPQWTGRRLAEAPS